MELLFMVCFFTGIGLTILTVVFGHFFELFGVDGFLDFSVDIGIPTSPMVYVLGITVFGGMGLILPDVFPKFPVWLIVLLAVFVAVIIATGFYRGVLVPLKKAQNTSAPDQEELIGVLAKVQESIPENGYGEISYIVNGNSYMAPAKTTDGHSIHKGTEVSICWIKDYVFYVIELENMEDVKDNKEKMKEKRR